MTLELILFFLAVAAIGVGSFVVLGFVYGLVHRPQVLFPPKLAIKMAVAAVVGAPFFALGGIALATWVMQIEFQKRADYKPLPNILAGIIISTVGSLAILAALYILPWTMLE